MAYIINKGANFSGLTIADDRFAAFETIRDSNDPLMQDRRTLSQPLNVDDFFGTHPTESNQMLHQMRLHTLVEQAKRKRAQDQITAEADRQEGYKFSF